MNLTLTSANDAKAREIRAVLEPKGISVAVEPIELSEYELDQNEIVRRKAEQAYTMLGRPLIVDDAGVYISRYVDFPGAITGHIYRALGVEGLYRLFDDGDAAFFRSLVCYQDEHHQEVFEGILHGNLFQHPVPPGSRMPFSFLFVPSGEARTLHTILSEDPQFLSARGSALSKFADFVPRVRATRQEAAMPRPGDIESARRAGPSMRWS